MAKSPSFWLTINLSSILLYPLSLIFCALAGLRRLLYKYHLLSSYRSPVPIIVAGNISVGGNGKTPLVMHLVESLKAKGFHPGVVSRGYGAKNKALKKYQQILVDISKEAQLFGDEPWMIAARTGIPVVIGTKRSQAVQYLLENHTCDIVISDDGMQHYAMQRDYEICVIDAKYLFGNQYCLPAGPLREKVARLKEVDLLVYNGLDNKPLELYADKSCIMQLKFQSMVALNDRTKQKNIETLSGDSVHAIAGIGQPSRFFQQLKQYNIHVIEHSFDDHHEYVLDELTFSDKLPVIMTEKDAVKCQKFNLENTWYIPVTAELTEDIVERIIATI